MTEKQPFYSIIDNDECVVARFGGISLEIYLNRKGEYIKGSDVASIDTAKCPTKKAIKSALMELVKTKGVDVGRTKHVSRATFVACLDKIDKEGIEMSLEDAWKAREGGNVNCHIPFDVFQAMADMVDMEFDRTKTGRGGNRARVLRAFIHKFTC